MTVAATVPSTRGDAQRLSFGRVIRSEWVRFRSLRSTWITLGVTVLFVIGLGALFTAARAAHWPPRDPGELVTFDPTPFGTDGYSAMPVQIFNYALRPQEEFQALAAAGIIVMLVVLLAMNSFAIWLRNRYEQRW